jgi:hypothetical protein
MPSARSWVLLCSLLASAPIAATCQGQNAREIELTRDDVSGLTISGQPQSRGGQQAKVSIEIAPAHLQQAQEKHLTVPKNITIGINGKPVDLALNEKSDTYEAVIPSHKAMPVNTVSHFVYQGGVLKGTGQASADWKVTFTDCKPGCQSFIFHTRCLVCIETVEW